MSEQTPMTDEEVFFTFRGPCIVAHDDERFMTTKGKVRGFLARLDAAEARVSELKVMIFKLRCGIESLSFCPICKGTDRGHASQMPHTEDCIVLAARKEMPL